MYEDTIAAISTPVGAGAIGIVRLSGPKAKHIAKKIFRGRLRNRYLAYGRLIDPATGETIDEALVTYMAAPHTYTREDMVEIDCHGGPMVLQRVLELTLRYGARPANPGEFTLRAFLKGRLDLAQAEAVLDIIQAKTAASLRVALAGLEGRLSEPVRSLRGRLMETLAYLTASVDFPDDEIAEEEVAGPLRRALDELRSLLTSADTGIVLRQGAKVAIVGRPNVGKSSLLNRLLGQSRAIVTAVPGTTRDTLEETLSLQGVPFVLVDTAGIAPSRDIVESLGIQRSLKAIENADLILFMVDGAALLSSEDLEIARGLQGKPAILVINKCDLPAVADTSALPWEKVFISALTGSGLAELEAAMLRQVLGGGVTPSDVPLVSNPRHKATLAKAEGHLSAALSGIFQALPTDLLVIELTACVNALGEITGETVGEDLLEAIFSRFCIGK